MLCIKRKLGIVIVYLGLEDVYIVSRSHISLHNCTTYKRFLDFYVFTILLNILY